MDIKYFISFLNKNQRETKRGRSPNTRMFDERGDIITADHNVAGRSHFDHTQHAPDVLSYPPVSFARPDISARMVMRQNNRRRAVP